MPIGLVPDLAPNKHQNMCKQHAKVRSRVHAFLGISELGTVSPFVVKTYIVHFARAHAHAQAGVEPRHIVVVLFQFVQSTKVVGLNAGYPLGPLYLVPLVMQIERCKVPTDDFYSVCGQSPP